MGRIQLDLEEIPLTIDSGYIDTLSTLIDIFAFAGKGRRYEDIPHYTEWGWIDKQTLIKPIEVLDLKDTILANDFNRYEKHTTVKVKGEQVPDKQTYYFNSTFRGYTIYYNVRKYYLHIMCQHSAILGKAKKEIIDDIKNIFRQFGVADKYIQKLDRVVKLERIDIKRDHRYIDEQHLALLKYIVEIAPETIVNGNYQKQDEKDEHPDIDEFDEIEYMKKFKSESNRTAEFVIYDKYLERLSEFNKGLITQEELEQYERVIRFEVRIKNEKLKSLARNENWGLDRDIDNYKDENVADELFEYYAEQVFGKEKIWRLDVAKRKIRNVSDEILTPYKKKECRKVLNDINKKGFTRAKAEYQFPSAFGDRIKDIRALGINILTIPTTWTDKEGNTHKTTYTSILNPIQKQNSIYEDDYIIPSKYWELVEQKKKETL